MPGGGMIAAASPPIRAHRLEMVRCNARQGGREGGREVVPCRGAPAQAVPMTGRTRTGRAAALESGAARMPCAATGRWRSTRCGCNGGPGGRRDALPAAAACPMREGVGQGGWIAGAEAGPRPQGGKAGRAHLWAPRRDIGQSAGAAYTGAHGGGLRACTMDRKGDPLGRARYLGHCSRN